MAKKKKKARQKKQQEVPIVPEKTILDRLEEPKFIVGFFVLIFIVLAFLYKPMVFEGMEPGGSDIISGIGKTHQMKMWEKKTGHYPLWNPSMFGGMPMYHRFNPRIWSIDTILNNLDFLGDWRLWFFLTGALGMFLLVKFLGLSAAAGMLSALAFILMPHFQALIIVGHFAKFRALMWMPYVLLTTLFLVKRRTIFAALLFALALALQFRTQHYQIMFYTLLLALFMGIPPLYHLIKEKYWKAVGKVFGLTAAAAVLTLLIVAQNLLSIQEYTPHSTRGGNAISIEETGEEEREKKGVGFDYATNWSYSISEWWNLIIPKFHGGTSNELYTGDAVPQLRNRELPTYWGTMPFTQSYEYLGILVVFLALIGIVFQWKRWEVKSLTILSILVLLMSLGKNFAPLYRLFFYYVPYFDKFRVPMMILTLLMFNASLLAAFGLSVLLKADLKRKEISQKLYVVAGIFAFILIIPLLFGSSFSLTQANEVQRYGQEVVNMLQKVRADMLQDSTLKSLFFFVLGIAGIFAVKKEWIRRDYLPLLFILITAIDLLMLDSHYVKGKFIDTDRAEQQQYRMTTIDREIQKDNSLYRVYPVGPIFENTRWNYYYQSIGGYSPAKMQTIQEIRENNLHVRVEGQLPINWNVIDMLNGKYVIAKQQLGSPRLRPIAANENQKLYAYRNTEALPRAFFVENYRVIADGKDRLKFLNSPEFNPATTAILETEPEKTVQAPDSTNAQITSYRPDEIQLKVYTDKPALLVLSEIYYPEGWSAILDNKDQLQIYKTNHLLRSVIVPSGEHTLTFEFHPTSYYAGLRISLVSLLVAYVLVLIFLYQRFGAQVKAWIQKKSAASK